jgi:HEAT repeat protein
MAKGKRFEAELHAAEALRHLPPGAEATAGIRAALGHPRGLVVAAGARAAAAHRLEGIGNELHAALGRLYIDPVERDPQCRGKLALVNALDELGDGDPTAFLRAARHVQMEPVWGGSQDSAPPLRIRATQALLRLGHHGLYRLLGNLLADPVGEVRGAAAQMLGALGGERAALLLRLRLAVGDADADVLADDAAGLLACEGLDALPLVVAQLGHDDRAAVGGVALALGGSRLPEALAPLLAALRDCSDHQLCRTLIDAIALLRSDAAAEELLALLATGSNHEALAAAKALRLYRDRSRLAERAEAAVAARRDDRLLRAWRDGICPTT